MSTGFIKRDRQLQAELRSVAQEVRFEPTAPAPVASAKVGAGWKSVLASLMVHAVILLVAAFAVVSLDPEFDLSKYLPAINAAFSDEEIEDIEAFSETGKIELELVQQSEGMLALVATEPEELTEVEIPVATILEPIFGTGSAGEGTGESGEEAESSAEFRFERPADGRAVTKGSFSVWTEPRDPLPYEAYYIVLQIRVPEGMTEYPADDLRIQVQGTDNFYLKIPDPKRGIYLLSDLPVIRGESQLVLPIPGAPQLVRDRIRIDSKKVLNEKQELEITF